MTSQSEQLDFHLTKPQTRAFKVLSIPRSDVNLEWGRGCGKSWFDRFIAWFWVASADSVNRLELLERLGIADDLTPEQRLKCKSVRGVRIVFLMPTRKQFADVHGRLFAEENEGDWAQLGGKLNRTTYQIEFPGGSWIAPFPASDHGSKRALGMRCDVVVCDEADDIDIGVFDTVVRPWFSEPWSLKIRATSGTPRRGRNGLLWARRVAGRDQAKPRYHSIHATYRDNPEIVDSTEVDDARANTLRATFEREWECNFDSGEGLVFPDFDESFHVRQPPPMDSFSEFHVGMDHGTEDPGVLLLCGIQGHGKDATVWLLDEWYETNVRNHVWDTRALAWKFGKFWPDNSRKDRVDDLRALGLDVGETDRGPGSVLAGVDRVADLLFIRTRETMGPAFQPIVTRYSRMYVSPKCVNTIREFGLYRRKKNPDGTFDDEPHDKDNHAMDCCRYVALGRFGRMHNSRSVTSGR